MVNFNLILEIGLVAKFLVKFIDFKNGLFWRIDDFKQIQILFTYVGLLTKHDLLDPLYEAIPITFTEKYDWEFSYFLVCMSVIASNSSSNVPKPPGRTINP